DILGKNVHRPVVVETTALGSAYLAGLAVGFWKSKDDIRENQAIDRVFKPTYTEQDREQRYRKWIKAVERAKAWETDEI
nr:glycerol kinase [Spirochaetaceae bacterium]MDA3812224.1 glycerol kinase [Spirochaetaceae bacterium]